jgi:hypothetical protein
VTPGEGVEILVNEPFGPDNEHGMPEGGVYTEKVLRFRSRLPPLLRRVMPMSVTEIHESSWFSNAKGSRCKTIYRNPFLGDRFYLSIESNHIAGIDTNDNAVNLSSTDHRQREVIHLDIAGDVPRKLPSEDPSTFVSQKTGRGKLLPNWWKNLPDAEAASDAAASSSDAPLAAQQGAPGPVSSVSQALSSTNESPPAASGGPASSTASTISQDGSIFQDAETDAADASLDASRPDGEVSRTTGADETPATATSADTPPEATGSAIATGDNFDGAPSILQPASSSDGDESLEDEHESSVAHSEPETPALDEKHTMTCYKVVKMEFTGFGMRRFVQRWVTRAVIPNGFIDIHRKLFCWMDDWADLTLKEIEAIENETAENVRAVFQEQESGASMAPKVAGTAPAQEHEYEYL